MKIIHETLHPLLGKGIVLDPRSSSHYRINNTGRFGFFIENEFGVYPNNNPGADTNWGELKTVNVTSGFKGCSIANIREDDWRSIRQGHQDRWEDSFVYKKIKQTLFVFYKSYQWTDLTYVIDRYGLANFDSQSVDYQCDWNSIVERIKRAPGYSGDCIDKDNWQTDYLALTSKGDSRYVYPSISFKTAAIKSAYANSKKYMNEYLLQLEEEKLASQGVIDL